MSEMSDTTSNDNCEMSEMPKTNADPIPLMRQLCKMIGINPLTAPFKRMVLVLDIDDVPRLYTEGFLNQMDEELIPTELQVEERPVVIDATTMQNRVFRTAAPRPSKKWEEERRQ